jgi:hypothetical protein
MKKSQLHKLIREEIKDTLNEEIFNGEITKGLIGQEPYYQVEWGDGQRMTIPEEHWEHFQRMVKSGA